MAKRADEIALFDGVGSLIDELSKERDIYVLSNNSKHTIESVLAKHGLLDKVIVLPRPTLFGKARAINKLVKTNKYFTHDVILVGDEVRDIEAAKKARVKSVAVTWGLQDAGLLKKAGANDMCSNVTELRKVLKAQ